MSTNYNQYTLNGIDAYAHRLYWNTALATILNALAAYLVINHTTKAMGKAKYYILATIIFGFLLEFHITFICGLFPLLPRAILCPAGIARYLGPFWGMTVPYFLVHFLLSFAGFSLLFFSVYQYFSVMGMEHTYHRPLGFFFMATCAILYPIPLIIFYLPNINYEAIKENVKQEIPELYDFFIAASCNGRIINKNEIIYLSSCILAISIVFFIAILMLIKIIIQFASLKNSLTSKTIKLQKQYFLCISLQMTVPFAVIIVPISFLMASIIFNKGNIEELNKWLIQIIGLHSCANAITVMIAIKAYREKLSHWWKKIIYCRCRKSQVVVASTSTFSLESKSYSKQYCNRKNELTKF